MVDNMMKCFAAHVWSQILEFTHSHTGQELCTVKKTKR